MPSKELILVNPCVSQPLIRLGLKVLFKNSLPSALLTLAGLTPKDYRIKFVNHKFFWRRGDFTSGALVGITCVTADAYEAYQLADRYRKAGSFVVMGGPHVSVLADEALKHADSVVIGEAESVWPLLLDDFENGSLEKTYEGEPVKDFFSPVYDYYLRLNPSLLRFPGIHTSRGCKYNCDFCATPFKELRFIRVEQVIELVNKIRTSAKSAWNQKPVIQFIDDNIFASPLYFKNLARQLAPLKVSWIGSSSIDIAFDEEALQLAKESGCLQLLIGFETIYPGRNPKTSIAQVSTQEDYFKAIKNIKAHRIRLVGAFIIGWDDDTHRDYLRLLWFLLRAGFWYPQLTILAPFPGSKIYEQLKKENRIRSFDWRKYNFAWGMAFRPKHMSIWSVRVWFIVLNAASIFSSRLILQILIFYYFGYFLVRVFSP